MLPGEEPEIGRLLDQVLGRTASREDGLTVASVAHQGGEFRLALDEGSVTAERLLVAAGRRAADRRHRPRVRRARSSRAHLDTDGRMRVLQDGRPVDGLWAVGDIVGKGAFTHTSIYQASVPSAASSAATAPRPTSGGPAVTYTDPEVGSVGLTEQQARDGGRDVRCATVDIAESSRGWLHAVGNEGLIKLVAEGDLLVGATSVGPMGGEVLSMLTTAIHGRVPVSTLRR